MHPKYLSTKDLTQDNKRLEKNHRLLSIFFYFNFSFTFLGRNPSSQLFLCTLHLISPLKQLKALLITTTTKYLFDAHVSAIGGFLWHGGFLYILARHIVHGVLQHRPLVHLIHTAVLEALEVQPVVLGGVLICLQNEVPALAWVRQDALEFLEEVTINRLGLLKWLSSLLLEHYSLKSLVLGILPG